MVKAIIEMDMDPENRLPRSFHIDVDWNGYKPNQSDDDILSSLLHIIKGSCHTLEMNPIVRGMNSSGDHMSINIDLEHHILPLTVFDDPDLFLDDIEEDIVEN